MKNGCSFVIIGSFVLTGLVGGAQADTLSGFIATPTSSGYTYTPVHFPGSDEDVALSGINNAGVIVGCVEAINDGCSSGLIKNGPVFSTVSYPGADWTDLNKINTGGTIVGDYKTGGTVHGLMDVGGTLSTIDFPGAFWTYAYGLNDAGEIVGAYLINSNRKGTYRTEALLKPIPFRVLSTHH